MVVPVWCPTCKEFHEDKIYHITLDGEGNSIVSPEIYQRLQECNSDLELMNEVSKPPAIRLDMDAHSESPTLYRPGVQQDAR